MERQNLEAIPTIINDENVSNEANRSIVDSNRSQYVSSCLFIAIKFRAVDSSWVRWATLLLSNVVLVKSKGKILQNFAAFSDYKNFTNQFKISKEIDLDSFQDLGN